MNKIYFVTIFLLTPSLVLAVGLVPCGGAGEELCQTCHVVILVNTLMTWLVEVLGIITAILIVVFGLRLATSSGNASATTEAKNKISTLLIGYMIVLAGWLLVDTGLKLLLSDANYGFWNSIQCVEQPTAIPFGRTTASGDNTSDLGTTAIDDRVRIINSSGSTQTDIANASKTLTGEQNQKIFRALISQESSNCTNKQGPATSYGIAYGCGQLLVSTARTLDPSLASLSNDEVKNKLLNDDAYNLTLSANYYKQLLGRYGNDSDLALAAYNGGPSANQSSKDCPGLKRWQCVWDSPGCYGTGKTDCKQNVGYAETRHYVNNINAIAGRL